MPRPLGITSLQILAAIRDGHTYGLEIVAHTGLPSGTVYPTLGRLKSKRLVRGSWENSDDAERAGRPRRRYYELTAAGRQALAEGRERVARASARLSPEGAG